MTIDEAIAHAREVANEQKRRSGTCVQNDSECDKFSACLKCAEEHEQLASWLEELSRRRVEELFGKTNEKAIRDKAIDDFVKMAYEELLYSERLTEIDIDYIAEQLKAGVNSGTDNK